MVVSGLKLAIKHERLLKRAISFNKIEMELSFWIVLNESIKKKYKVSIVLKLKQ
jgi:hypothetical protein